MSDELDVLLLVAARLERAGIRYMVSGSMAMNYYAQPRMTRDIDLVVELSAADAERTAALFVPEFYCEPEAIREAVRHKGMFNIIHETLVVKVDCIVRKDSPYRLAEFERRRRVAIGDTSVWVVAAEDLVLSKLDWARDSHSALQLGDVRNLIASVETLDWAYIERWAGVLGIADLLAEVRA